MQAYPNHYEASEQFANLVFGGLQLLIPQTDIYSLEPSVDMSAASSQVGSVGQIQQQGENWFLYALAEDLSLLTRYPSSYHIAVLFKNMHPAYGLLCEQISTLARNQLSIHPIPAVMRSINSPLLALAVYGEEVRYISSAAALSRLLPQSQNG